MTLTLVRSEQNQLFTAGSLYEHGQKKAVTLEPGTGHPYPAIPEGTYQIELRQSARFGMIMPFLISVPDREDIEIHFGNMPKDTKGCILVGEATRFPYLLANSKATLKPIIKTMTLDLDESKANSIEITSINGGKEAPTT